MKICFVSAMFFEAGRRADVPPSFEPFGNHDFIFFTGCYIPKLLGWKQIITDQESLLECTGTITSNKANISFQRFFKFALWKYVDLSAYDMVVYCDAYFCPNKAVDWDHLCHMANVHGIVQQPHKNNPYNECDLIAACKKDSRTAMDNMKQFLHDNKCPKNAEMMENTCFAYDPKNTKLLHAFEEFWDIYRTFGITYRDQPLWGYVQYKHEIKPYKIMNLFSAYFVRGVMGNHYYT